jgi:lysophospholipase L1-like esterase
MSDSIKTILCFGDSNTWGYVPGSEEVRYSRDIRWTSILQKLLGSSFEVISEGLPGRVIKSDKARVHKNGMTYILPCLLSHMPVDTVVLMLGTNDVKYKYELTAQDIANNLEEKINVIKGVGGIDIVVVCPPPVMHAQNGWHEIFNMNTMVELQKLYKEVAEKNNCKFINAGDYVTSSPLDGVHLDEGAHQKLAEVLKDKILF